MNKIMMSLVLGIFLFSFASAAEWDNTIKYSEDDLNVTFENALGFGSKIGNAKLLSHKSVNQIKEVSIGRQVVMWYEFNFGQLYQAGLGNIDFIDMKTGKSTSREYKYVYLQEETCEDYTHSNSSTYERCVPEQWKDFTGKDIPKGKIVIGIEVEVKKGDWVDGVWNIVGKKVSRHAEWTEGSAETFSQVGGSAADVSSLNMDFFVNVTNGYLNATCISRGDGSSASTFQVYVNQSGSNIGSFIISHPGGTGPEGYCGNASSINYSSALNSGIANVGIHRLTGDILFQRDPSTDFGGTSFSFYNKPHPAIGSGGAIFTFVDVTVTGLEVGLRAPSNNTAFSTNNPVLSANITDTPGLGVTNVTLRVHDTVNGSLAFTATNTSGVLGEYNFTTTLQEGNYNWTVISVDSSNTETFTSETRLFSIDLVEPTVSLLLLANDSQTNKAPLELNATLTSGNYTLDNATLTTWFTNGTLFNISTNTSIGGTSDITVSFDKNFTTGNYYWNVRVFYQNPTLGSFGNAEQSSNFTFEWIPFEVQGETFQTSTFETDNETFSINITTDSDILNIGTFLNYNGTDYAATHSCSGGLCQIETTIDIPLLESSADSENKSFFWKITLFSSVVGTFSSNTTTNVQNVSNILFTNSAAGNQQALNFSIFNESDRTSAFSSFDGSFDFWLGSGTVRDSYNFSSDGKATYSFYINRGQEFNIDSRIEIENNTKRLYGFLEEKYTNKTTNKSLFLPESTASNIIIEVKNQGLIPLEDIVVNISRFYPSINKYIQIESRITDEFGEFVAKLIENDVKYKFSFYKEGKLIKESEDITIACRSTICILPFVIETEDDLFDRFDNVSLFSFDLSFNNETNNFVYSWDDQTGNTARHRLEVNRITLNESTLVCNITSSSLVATLSCDVGSNTASYRAQSYRMQTGQRERRIALLNIKVGDTSGIFGVEGLFWAFILLMTSFSIGAFNPGIGAIFYGAGFILMGVIGIIAMPIPVFFANTVLVGLFVWAVRT